MSQKPLKRMFWDIETSLNVGVFWAAGWKKTIAADNIIKERAIICICWKWEGGKKVYSLSWDDGDDKELLEKFMKHANDADEMVAHNGDRFDIKWYNARCLVHGLEPPPARKTVDTLKIARSKFYLNSNRLDYLAKLLLGEGKQEVGFDLWEKVTLANDQASLKKMIAYCKLDVALLERVYEKISAYAPAKTHAGVSLGKSKWSCAHCGASHVKKSKRTITAKGTVQFQMQCQDCGRYYSISSLSHQQYTESKHNVRE
jgi:predicted PolB exonuclease-like 3'-5' exonuclease